MDGDSGENYGFCLVVGRAALNAFSMTLILECIVLLSMGRVDGAQSSDNGSSGCRNVSSNSFSFRDLD